MPRICPRFPGQNLSGNMRTFFTTRQTQLGEGGVQFCPGILGHVLESVIFPRFSNPRGERHDPDLSRNLWTKSVPKSADIFRRRKWCPRFRRHHFRRRKMSADFGTDFATNLSGRYPFVDVIGISARDIVARRSRHTTMSVRPRVPCVFPPLVGRSAFRRPPVRTGVGSL